MFNITGNGQTTIITPTNPEEFKEALNLLWKKAFIDNAEEMFNNLGQDKINQLFKLDGMNTITNFNQFKSLLNNNQAFLDNALKFIKVE